MSSEFNVPEAEGGGESAYTPPAEPIEADHQWSGLAEVEFPLSWIDWSDASWMQQLSDLDAIAEPDHVVRVMLYRASERIAVVAGQTVYGQRLDDTVMVNDDESGLWRSAFKSRTGTAATGLLLELYHDALTWVEETLVEHLADPDVADRLTAGLVDGEGEELSAEERKKKLDKRRAAVIHGLKSLRRSSFDGKLERHLDVTLVQIAHSDDRDRWSIHWLQQSDLNQPRYLAFPNRYVVDLIPNKPGDGEILDTLEDVRGAYCSVSAADEFDAQMFELVRTGKTPPPPACSKLLEHVDAVRSGYILNILASSLLGGQNRELVIVIGEKGGGKTSLINALQQSLSSTYACSLDDGALQPERKGNAASPALMQLQPPKRVAVLAEIEGIKEVDGARLKTLAKSGETLVARPLYGQLVEFVSYATIIGVGNALPARGLGSEDAAIEDRLVFIQFPSVPADRLDRKMLTAWHSTSDGSLDERRYFLYDLIRRAILIDLNERVERPAEVLADIKKWTDEDKGPAHAWLSEVVVDDVNGFLPSGDIWRFWCLSNGADPKKSGGRAVEGETKSRLVQRIRQQHPKLGGPQQRRVDGRVARGYVGVRLTDGAESQLAALDDQQRSSEGMFR